MPSTRAAGRATGALVALAFVGVAAAQYGGTDSPPGIGVRFAAGFVTNLLLGGALLAIAPDYAERTLAEFRSDPGAAFVRGLLVWFAVPIPLVLLAVPLVGLFVAVPGLIVLGVVGIVGSAVLVVIVGAGGIRRETPGKSEVVVGAFVLALVTAIPVVGAVFAWFISLPGVGLVGRDLYRAWKG